MKFAHLGDCHLGAWRHPKLRDLNLASFQKALDISIKEEVDFVIIAGDLFDTAYPSIDTLKDAFSEFKKLKDKNIPCFIIAGSHDFSASGKTFLDVLEKAGLCFNVFNSEIKDESIMLNPTICQGCAIYGYPGKKSGIEVQDLRKVKIQDSPGFYKIFMLHTTLDRAKGSLPIDAVKEDSLPKADYYALGHLHINYEDGKFVYSGPIFPNNMQELEELKSGSFYIIDTERGYKRIELKLKDVEVIDMEIKNALTATEFIFSEIKKRNIKDKIVILKLSGKLEEGKTSNINFTEIEKLAEKQEAFAFLKSTSQLITEEPEIYVESSDIDELENKILEDYIKKNSNKFNLDIKSLINNLDIEKQEDEKSADFELRLFEDISKTLKIEK